MMPDHICSQIPFIVYAYDQNGNMTSRTVDGVEWAYTYNADGQLTQIRKNNQLVSEYGYDGDGKRVWAKDYEGYSTGEFKETIYIGNYYEFVREDEAAGQGEGAICESPDYCSYLPMIFQIPRGISYYYADGQRIAMRDKDGVVSYLYGDQLGSVSVAADASGNLVSTTLYEPWGEIRNTYGTSPTDYGYTGQKQEGDIYFYQSRWYDPSIGRFMQADTIVPLQVQGTQAFDRYSYVNNNPMRYTDPSGHYHVNVLLSDSGTFDKLGNFLIRASFITREYSGKNDLEGMAQILELAGAYYQDDYDGYFKNLNRVFLGTSSAERKTILYDARFSNEYPMYYFSDTGFHPDYRDGGNQPHHLWAYISNGSGWDGAFVAHMGNLFHEIVQSIFGSIKDMGAGTSWQDYRLSVDGIAYGQEITRENFDPSKYGEYLRNRFGPEGPGWGESWRDFQEKHPLWGQIN